MTAALKYGLLAATAGAGWLFASYALGLHTEHLGVARYTDMAQEVFLVAALWCVIRHQLTVRGPYWLPVWQGLLHGLLTALVAAMGAYIALSFYVIFVNPEYYDLQLEHQVAVLREMAIPEERIREFARSFRWSTGPIGLPVMVGSFYLLVGFVMSPLITLWLNWRRKEPLVAR